MRFSWLLVVAACGSSKPVATASKIDPTAHSRELFDQMARVLTHPRCVNCHPADDTPRQGNDHVIHDPPVLRGTADRGVVGMQCVTCHQDHNAELARIPGAPGWHLAPVEMAWLGKTPAQICAQLKDPARNGGRTLAQIQDHLAHDPLVGWGWNPGAGREPAPGTQAELGAIAQQWIDTGAACPEETP
ncbi:MAG TPA: Isoquinoline 1-oxidoreductase subunit [Kofleriaceae bacterium]|nr:Isoquinoline 1-oxidoreductase subunit [Kofleriaceae bacterium]